MHSKTTQKRALRLTPYLLTAGLGLSVAANAASPTEEAGVEQTVAQEAPADDAMSEVPAPTIDTNGDGTPDAWDRSGDGAPDAWDTDADGKPDLLDDDGDGKPD